MCLPWIKLNRLKMSNLTKGIINIFLSFIKHLYHDYSVALMAAVVAVAVVAVVRVTVKADQKSRFKPPKYVQPHTNV